MNRGIFFFLFLFMISCEPEEKCITENDIYYLYEQNYNALTKSFAEYSFIDSQNSSFREITDQLSNINQMYVRKLNEVLNIGRYVPLPLVDKISSNGNRVITNISFTLDELSEYNACLVAFESVKMRMEKPIYFDLPNIIKINSKIDSLVTLKFDVVLNKTSFFLRITNEVKPILHDLKKYIENKILNKFCSNVSEDLVFQVPFFNELIEENINLLCNRCKDFLNVLSKIYDFICMFEEKIVSIRAQVLNDKKYIQNMKSCEYFLSQMN